MNTIRAVELLGLFLSLLVSVLGASVIVGWYLHLPLLLQVHPSFAPMQFNSALGFVLSGLATFAMQRMQPRVARLLAIGVLLIGGLTLWQFVTGFNLHIDQLFVQGYVTFKTPSPGRMALCTAVCFCLVGVNLLVLTSPLAPNVKAYANSVLAPAILALALITLSGYAIGEERSYAWANLTGMAVHTATAFVLLGVVFYALQKTWQPVSFIPGLGIALLVLVVGLWQTLAIQDVTSSRSKVTLRAEQIKQIWSVDSDLRNRALRRLAYRWEKVDTVSRSAWDHDTRSYLQDFGFLYVAHIDASGKLVFVTGDHALAKSVLAANSGNSLCREKNMQSRASLRSTLGSFPVLLEVAPLTEGGHIDGCIVGADSLLQILDRLRARAVYDRYPLTVTADGLIAYQEPSDGFWSVETILPEPGLDLRLRLAPRKAQLAYSALPLVILGTGIALDALLVCALYLMVLARRRAEDSLRLQQQMQQDLTLREQVIENAPYGILLTNQDGNIDLVNRAVASLFGYSTQELVGQPIELLIPIEQRLLHVQNRRMYQSNRDVARRMAGNLQVMGRHRDGNSIPVEVNLAPVALATQAGVIAIIVDVSERLQARRRIEEQNARFAIASLAAGLGFWDLDIQSNSRQWDDQMYRLYGRSRSDDEQPLTVWKSGVHPDDRARIEQELSDAIVGTRDFDTEFRVVRPDGAVAHLKAVASVTRDASGRGVHMFGVNFDVTERKQAETRQGQLVNELRRINDELKNFAYVASHDLKSPLRGIDQLATWISEDLGDKIDSDTQNHLRLMRKRILRMEKFLDDLLDYSRVGRSNDELVKVDTHALVTDVFDMSTTDTQIKLNVAENMPMLRTWKVPLELVFRNLISNAIKHHDKPQGIIGITARSVANGFEFAVTDDGPGIPSEHQQRVFGMFQTLKPRDEVEGSGMGLALVKKAVESMGGTVTLESNGLQGSAFRFTWPARIYEEKA